MNAFTNLKRSNSIRIGIPSKGRMYDGSISLLERAGLSILQNPRNYIGSILEFPDVELVFMRQKDIIRDVQDGILTMGIAGFDLLCEFSDDVFIVQQNLGFGSCSIEVAVPDTWDIEYLSELDRSKSYRVATKFPKLTAKYLDEYNINYELINSSGTIEVTPILGRADFIVDVVSTGATLRANSLKRLKDGMILISEAALFGNIKLLSRREDFVKSLLELLESTFRAKNYLSLIANIPGEPEIVLPKLDSYKELVGLQSPTVTKLVDGSFFAIQVIIKKGDLISAITRLREINAAGIAVMPILYLFEGLPNSYINFRSQISKGEVV